MTLIHIITICRCVYVHTRVVFYGAGTRDNLHREPYFTLTAFACNSVAIRVKHLIIQTYTYTPAYIVQIAVIQSGFNNSELYKRYNYILNYEEIVFVIVYVIVLYWYYKTPLSIYTIYFFISFSPIFHCC